MKKTALLFITLSLLIGTPLLADAQVDIGINIPVIIGVTVDGENLTEDIPFTLPVPDIMFNYFFEFNNLKLGIGARAWSVIILTGAYPIISAELELDRLLLNANIGGLAFAYTGIGGSGFETGNVFFPEISAAFRLTDWFAIGASVLGIYVPDVASDELGYTVNILGRFRVK